MNKINKNLSWLQLRNLPLIIDNKINTMRIHGSNIHFGNPYSHLKKDALIYTESPYYQDNIIPNKDTIFVFGSNTEGKHGSGAAKYALTYFNAKYHQAEGLQGNSYAIVTKDLNKSTLFKKEKIINSIVELYKFAEKNNNKFFKIAYRNTFDKTTLNGYTGLEMQSMFIQASRIYPIPNNVLFSKEWVHTMDFLNINKAVYKYKRWLTLSDNYYQYFSLFWQHVLSGYYQQFVKKLEKNKELDINDINKQIRQIYIEELEYDFKDIFGTVLLSKDNSTLILQYDNILKEKLPLYTRVMVGNHGIYIEFENPKNNGTFIRDHLQYKEYSHRNVKLYKQTREVNYADYKVDMWYVDLYEFFNKKKPIYDFVHPFRRKWIREQILGNHLDNKELLYMKTKDEFFCHADQLAELIQNKTLIKR
jgi:hypothetical protein